jgi:histone H3/H4
MVSTYSVRNLSKKMKVRLSKDAIEEIKDFIKIYSLRIAKLSIEIARAAKRKTVRKEDVLLAIK